MFSNVLNKNEKKNFLELIYKIANINDNYTEEQQQLIESYKTEMGLSEIADSMTVDELLEYFGKKPIELKKIVFFELYGMLIADYKIDEKESNALRKIEAILGLDEETYNKIIGLAQDLQAVYDRIYNELF